MALQKTVTAASGVALTDAYHKVTNLRWKDDQPDRVRFDLCTYPGSTEADAGAVPADKKSLTMTGFNKDHGTDGIHKQVYTWLKDVANAQGFDTGTTDV
jgi:hypothetical protein